MNKILLKYQLILEVDLVLFPSIDLETAFQLTTRRRKQYINLVVDCSGWIMG